MQSSTCDDSLNHESKSELQMDPNETIQLPRIWYDDQLLKRLENIHFDVEAWYKVIHTETFYTEFLPISPSIAQAFVNFYRTRYTSTKPLNANDIQLIASIRDQIRGQIFNSNKNEFRRHGAFVRLSSRSPKDGLPLDHRKFRRIYQKKLNELEMQNPEACQSIEGKANMQMIAFSYAQFLSLKVTDEVQALNLILSSERVYYDLNAVLDCQKVKDEQITNTNNIELYDWNNHIIVRQWNDRLDPSMEFRCFVHQSKLTAITQYDYHCKYYHLQDDQVVQRIKITLIKYWQDKIQPLLGPLPEQYSNYVIDIGLLENRSKNEYDCIVIEMNPFKTSTGGSLFDWNADSDQLHGRGDGTEIRVQKDYYPYISDYMEYVLEVNQCDGKEDLSDNEPGKEPYFIFLDRVKEQLSLW